MDSICVVILLQLIVWLCQPRPTNSPAAHGCLPPHRLGATRRWRCVPGALGPNAPGEPGRA